MKIGLYTLLVADVLADVRDPCDGADDSTIGYWHDQQFRPAGMDGYSGALISTMTQSLEDCIKKCYDNEDCMVFQYRSAGLHCFGFADYSTSVHIAGQGYTGGKRCNFVSTRAADANVKDVNKIVIDANARYPDPCAANPIKKMGTCGFNQMCENNKCECEAGFTMCDGTCIMGENVSCGPVASSSDSSCPSSECWTFADNKCTLKPACVVVECGHLEMKMFAREKVFGENNFGDTKMTQSSEPENVAAAAGVQWYQKSCSLADGLNQCANHEMVGSELVFTETVGGDGGNLVDLGGVKINTDYSSASVDYKCTYATEVTVTSADFSVQDVSILGTHTGEGTLDDGFSLTVGDGSATILGGLVDVTAKWEVTLSGFSFHFGECNVKHGPTQKVPVIKEGCHSTTLGAVAPTSPSVETVTFKYKTFTVENETTKTQTMECNIKICSGDNNCAKTGTCPVTQHYGYQ